MLDEDVLRRITLERDQLKVDLAAAHLEITQRGEEIAALSRDLAVTTAERDTCQRRLGDAMRESAPGNA